jgi:hypothetical protein
MGIERVFGMKRLAFSALLMICSVAHAEWVFAGRTQDSSFTEYYEDTSIRLNEGIAKIWTLRDYFKMQIDPKGRKSKSSKILSAVDCNSETIAIISFTDFSKSMGNGNPVVTFTVKKEDWDWVPISPGSINSRVFEIACGL